MKLSILKPAVCAGQLREDAFFFKVEAAADTPVKTAIAQLKAAETNIVQAYHRLKQQFAGVAPTRDAARGPPGRHR